MAIYRQTRLALPSVSPAVLYILIACVVIFILQNTPVGAAVTANLVLSVPSLLAGRIWTLVTFGLVHLTFAHLFFNMLVLYFLGPRLEARMGTKGFIGFYLLSGLTAGVAFCVWVLLAGTPRVSVLGASGSIYGIYAMWALLWPDEHLLLWGVIPIKVKWLMLILVGASVLMLWSGSGITAHQAHIGGALGGLLWWYLTEMRPRRPHRPQGRRRVRLRLVRGAADDRFRDIVRGLDD